MTTMDDIDDSDYLDRAKLLCSMGHKVMISNFSEYFKLVQYLTTYTQKQLGLTMGVRNFIEIFDEGYYDNLKGGILEAFGNIFKNNMKISSYLHFLYKTSNWGCFLFNCISIKISTTENE